MTLLWLAILILLTVLGKRCQTKPLKTIKCLLLS